MSILLDGKSLRDKILEKLKEKIKENNLAPKIAIILLGEDKRSLAYIKQKENAATFIGAVVSLIKLAENASQEDLEKEIKRLNADKQTSGIIVQLPLPNHINQDKALANIDQNKDVDGMTKNSPFVSAAPGAVMQVLEEYKIALKDKSAVILGSSGFVGKPLTLLFKRNGANVIEIDENTPRPYDQLVKKGDIVVSAVGKARLVKAEMIKEGAIVIDIGFNTETDTGKLVGDVDFEAACEKASLITPVPGGIGPVTVAMLMKNLVKASEKIHE